MPSTSGVSVLDVLRATEEIVGKPLFEQAFEEAGIDATVVNAEGDAQQQQAQAEQAIAEGAGVIVLTELDSGSGATILDLAAGDSVQLAGVAKAALLAGDFVFLA